VAGEVVGQALAELADGERGVGAKVFHGAVDTRPRAVPHFAFGIARPNEKDDLVLWVFAGQHQHRLRLVEPREVIQVRILPIFVLHVVISNGDGGGGNDHDGTGHLAHQGPAAVGVERHRHLFGVAAPRAPVKEREKENPPTLTPVPVRITNGSPGAFGARQIRGVGRGT
jgi:hypothetical protein